MQKSSFGSTANQVQVIKISDAVLDPLASVIPADARLGFADRWGTFSARWGVNRMNYAVNPGLYRVGEPDQNSPVLVTANYKMSFDHLRRELVGIHSWILVLDTRGINVWCAAGKGTFGTDELVRRIAITGLAQVVGHRNLIVPQLGAPGVAAHEVRKRSGFKVVYGPVRASDIRAFLDNDMKAGPEMRSVRFDLWDRLVLTPMELVAVLKPILLLGSLLLLLNLVGIVKITFSSLLPYLGAILTGAVMTPALLPWIPGRAFAWKGWLLGMVWTVMAVLGLGYVNKGSILESLSLLLLLPAISSFLAMNFTGASTYTSLSGVKKEMRLAVPLQVLSAAAGIVIGLVALFT